MSREVERYLAVVANMKPDSGAYAQFANVSLVADGKGVSEVKINGQPLQADKTYRMATLNFNALGGDGYPKLDGLPSYVNTGFIDAEVLKQVHRETLARWMRRPTAKGRDRLSIEGVAERRSRVSRGAVPAFASLLSINAFCRRCRFRRRLTRLSPYTPSLGNPSYS